jgi:hypothetical protein
MASYLVYVDVEFESELYLTPARFDARLAALRHAAGIAKSLEQLPNAPDIIITGTDSNVWSVRTLLVIGALFNWFED